MATETTRVRLSAAERRNRIMEGAMQVFAERGYHDASMTEIARAGGISPAVIYDHFASKQELHALLMETQTQGLLMHVGQAVLAASDEPEVRMRTSIDAFFAFVEDNPFAWRLLFRDPPSDPAIAVVYDRITQQASMAIAAFLDSSAPPGLDDFEDRDQALEMFGQLMRTSLDGLAAWWYEHREVPRADLVERVMEFCWNGLGQLANEGLSKGEPDVDD